LVMVASPSSYSSARRKKSSTLRIHCGCWMNLNRKISLANLVSVPAVG
jgi:hypothetical protein